MDCLFCKIVAGSLPTTFIYEDEHVVAFDDIRPRAPHHQLIIPRRHIATINDLTDNDTLLVGHMIQIAKKLAVTADIAEAGYRLVMNCRDNGGQEIYHLHLHLLGGRPLHWPPG